MTAGRKWTEDEIEKAIALYFVTPFGRLHQSNPDVIQLSKQLNRSVGSLALKLVNLASIDPTIERKGMSNHSNLDKIVWDRVFEKMLHSASQLPSHDQGLSDQAIGFTEKEQDKFEYGPIIGKDVFTIKSTRQGQYQFRKIVSANYDFKCAISGINQGELLVAGHISPWSKDNANRLNPRNGIYMNRLHERAFDEGLMAFEDTGKIIYSQRLKHDTRVKLQELEINGFLQLPKKFQPDFELIRNHREVEFQR